MAMPQAPVTTISGCCDRDEDERPDRPWQNTHCAELSFSFVSRARSNAALRLDGRHPWVSRGSKWIVSTFHWSKKGMYSAGTLRGSHFRTARIALSACARQARSLGGFKR